MTKKPSPRDLIPLLREVKFDDTFDQVWAVLRFDAKLCEDDIKTQLLLDLRHKQNPRQSKPKFFLTMSSIDQHLNLLTAAAAMATFHHHRSNLSTPREDLDRSVKSLLDLIRGDAVSLTQLIMVAVQRRQSELAAEERNPT